MANPCRVLAFFVFRSGRRLARRRIDTKRVKCGGFEQRGADLRGVGMLLCVALVSTSAKAGLVDGNARNWEQRALGVPVVAIRFSSDGKEILSVSKEGNVREWDVRSGWGSVIGRLDLVALGVLHVPPNDNPARFVPRIRSGCAAISADGRTVVCANGLRVWSLDLVKRTSWKCPVAFYRPVWCLAISADGTYFVAGSKGSRAKVVGIPGGDIVAEVEPLSNTPIYCVAPAPDGSSVLMADGIRAYIWRLEDGRELKPLKAQRHHVKCAVWLSDRLVATADGDSEVVMWTPGQEGPRRRFKTQISTIIALSVSPDGSIIACGGSGEVPTVELWRARTCRLIKRFQVQCRYVSCLSFSPDGSKLAVGGADGAIRIFDLGELLKEAPIHRRPGLSDAPRTGQAAELPGRSVAGKTPRPREAGPAPEAQQAPEVRRTGQPAQRTWLLLGFAAGALIGFGLGLLVGRRRGSSRLRPGDS